jgi:hypothetical protein
MARVSGVCVLVSMAAEIAAIAVAAAHGTGPASMNVMDWGVADQLLFFQPHWMSSLFALGIVALCLSMLAWLAMYSVLALGGASSALRRDRDVVGISSRHDRRDDPVVGGDDAADAISRCW